MENKGYFRLMALFALYFVALGASSFTSVYLGGKGLDNGQIGMLLSIPPIVAMVVQPVWGLAGDRARLKRTVLAVAYAGTAIACFVVNTAQGVWPLLLAMCLYNAFSQGCSPIITAICMEYTENRRSGFGPIRMSGSITYQLMILLLGFLLSGSMPQLFTIMGILYVLCSAYALAMPPVEGHQHEKQKKVSPFVLLKDRRILLLLSMTFCGKVASMFYVSFFNKFSQELFQSNSIMSVLSFVAVFMEIPFLFFANRFMKKLKITYWVLLGYAINAIRFIGIACTRSLPVLLLLQLGGVSVMACFEFYPSLYLNTIAPKELLGSMQSLSSLLTFGVTQIAGSLIGGFMADALGMQMSFGVYGVFLLLALAAFLVPARKADMYWQGVSPRPSQPDHA